MNLKDVILRLHDIESIKFGSFTLKSGIESPFYIDLRMVPSYPLLLKAISAAIWEKVHYIDFETICGVPYTAMPIATSISLSYNIPMVMRRKEVKNYGTKKIIEGAFKPGQRCLIVEDLITSGRSIMETADSLKHEGLIVRDAVVLIDREQGGAENLLDRKINVQSVMTLSNILTILLSAEKVTAKEVRQVQEFIDQHKKVALV